MRYGAICERNLVVLEFTRKEEISENKVKNKIKTKNSKFKDILVKFMFNLECGNIRKKDLLNKKQY